jgi:hypothetical protein
MPVPAFLRNTRNVVEIVTIVVFLIIMISLSVELSKCHHKEHNMVTAMAGMIAKPVTQGVAWISSPDVKVYSQQGRYNEDLPTSRVQGTYGEDIPSSRVLGTYGEEIASSRVEEPMVKRLVTPKGPLGLFAADTHMAEADDPAETFKASMPSGDGEKLSDAYGSSFNPNAQGASMDLMRKNAVSSLRHRHH